MCLGPPHECCTRHLSVTQSSSSVHHITITTTITTKTTTSITTTIINEMTCPKFSAETDPYGQLTKTIRCKVLSSGDAVWNPHCGYRCHFSRWVIGAPKSGRRTSLSLASYGFFHIQPHLYIIHSRYSLSFLVLG